MFDFVPMGILIAFVGIGFLVIVARALLPQEPAYEAARLEFSLGTAGTALGLRLAFCIRFVVLTTVLSGTMTMN